MDDMYVNDGAMFDEKITDQAKEENLERAKVEESFPILDELITKLETDFEDSNKLSSIGLNTGVPIDQSLIILQGHLKFQALLSTEIANLKEWRERYLK